MIEHSIREGSLILTVLVVPRASKSQIVGEHDGALRVRIAAPPVDGAANDELVRLLAKEFKVPRKAVSVISGHTARLKQVSVEGVSPDALERVTETTR